MSQPPLPPRPKSASVFMAVPVVFGGLLMVAVLSLVVLSQFEGCIRGDRMVVQFQSVCEDHCAEHAELAYETCIDAQEAGDADDCEKQKETAYEECMGLAPAEASAVISERVAMMGLGDSQITVDEDTISLVATFPGYSETENQTIPATLAATGRLQLLDQDTAILKREDIETAQLNQDEDGMPIVEIQVTEAAIARVQAGLDADPGGSMQFVLDDTFIISRPNARPLEGRLIRILVDQGDVGSRMQRMADLNILLNTQVMPCEVEVQSVELYVAEPDGPR